MNAIERYVRKIIEQVRKEGDKAIVRLTFKYDRVRLRSGEIRVKREEVNSALKEAGPGFTRLVRNVARNIEAYHKKQMPHARFFRNAHGARVGWLYRPIEIAGVYLPGGTAPLVSTALMTIVPAKVAGVNKVIVCTPAGSGGKVNPCILAACDLLGADEIYRAGGAQAIAAMAFGTGSVPRVDKIVGPGNVYVTEAKRQLYGKAGIDMTAGPSEVAVIADSSAPAALVASDLLAQAEHGPLSRAVLLATSGRLLGEVRKEIKRQTVSTKRKLGGLRLVRCGTLAGAVKIANRMAPEHLEIVTRNPERVVPSIRNAGAIFIGPYSATALGDYVSGPSHVLPTGGTARFFSVLSVDTFLRRVSYVRYDRSSLKKAAAAAERLAELEGLEAHARSVRLRAESDIK